MNKWEDKDQRVKIKRDPFALDRTLEAYDECIAKSR